MCTLSIIIPSYNAEQTLQETLLSVHRQVFADWEGLIINDGSTDGTEEIALRWVKKDRRFKYYLNSNQGLGKSRNYGITRAKGNFILPLDADNNLAEDFTQNAIKVLERDQTCGVVHGDAKFFGEKEGDWKVSTFNLDHILIQNYIDACAVYRKSLWEEIGGYDEKMPYQGNEDWDFWIRLGKTGVKFHHIEQTTFFYRVSKDSMINSFSQEMFRKNREYISQKHSFLYYCRLKEIDAIVRNYNRRPFRTALIFLKKGLLKAWNKYV